MIITDKKKSAYMAVSTNDVCVKAERRKDNDGGYCALFYTNGRSVALGRKETLRDAKEMVNDFIGYLVSNLVVMGVGYTFDYDEPCEKADDKIRTLCDGCAKADTCGRDKHRACYEDYTLVDYDYDDCGCDDYEPKREEPEKEAEEAEGKTEEKPKKEIDKEIEC